MLHVTMEKGTKPEMLYALYDEGMGMWISKRGHCTQQKYAKLYTETEVNAIIEHAAKQNYKITKHEAQLVGQY